MKGKPLGTNALLWEWAASEGLPCTDTVLEAAALLSQACLDPRVQPAGKPAWVLDLVPAYNSLALVFDPWRVHQYFNTPKPQEWVNHWATAVLASPGHVPETPTRNIKVPVCYDPELAPDLLPAAAALGLSVEGLIARHAQTTYRVCFLGFLPGFPYMAAVDASIRLPRHAQPRKQVAAGSVGMAEWQTGIYPVEAPGGWQIIGRTPLVIFDPSLEDPCFFQPGDQVVFEPMARAAFDHWQKPTP